MNRPSSIVLALLAIVMALNSRQDRIIAQAALSSAEPSSRPSEQILALVRDLSNDEFDARQAAQQKLIDMGIDIEPQLRSIPEESLTPEALARLAQVLREFSKFEPSVITMHYKDAPLQDVLDDFARQADAELGQKQSEITQFARDKLITIDLDKVSYWEALSALAKNGGLVRARGAGFGAPLLLRQIREMQSTHFPTVHSQACGAFLVIADQVSQVPPTNNGWPPPFFLTLHVMTEPKLVVLSPAKLAWWRDAISDTAHPFSAGPEADRIYFESGKLGWILNASLKDSSVPGTKIATLHGEMQFVIQIRSQPIDIDNIVDVDNVTKTLGPNTITFNAFDDVNGGILYMTMVGPMTRMLDIRGLLHEIVLTGERGNSYPSYMRDRSNGKPDRLRYEVSFGSARQFRSLHWAAPVETRILKVPFELKDLELPADQK